MFSGGLIGAIAPVVVIAATAVVFVLAVLLAIGFSLSIGRRDRVARQPVAPQRRAPASAPRTPTPRPPADVQGRLRRLTAALDNGPDSATYGQEPAVPIVAEAFYQDEPASVAPVQPATSRLPVVERDVPRSDIQDSTRYFNDAPPPLSPKVDQTLDPVIADEEWTSGTHFFGDDEAAPLLKANHPRPADGLTSSEWNSSAMASWPPSTSNIPDLDEGTTMLSPFPAPPAELHALVARVSLPHVLALTVIDGVGRLLAGEDDPDLTREILALVAESGAGMGSDLEQAVLSDDDSPGVIIVLPTGTQAILGVLASKADDGSGIEMRRELRALANEIGEILHHAS